VKRRYVQHILKTSLISQNQSAGGWSQAPSVEGVDCRKCSQSYHATNDSSGISSLSLALRAAATHCEGAYDTMVGESVGQTVTFRPKPCGHSEKKKLSSEIVPKSIGRAATRVILLYPVLIRNHSA